MLCNADSCVLIQMLITHGFYGDQDLKQLKVSNLQEEQDNVYALIEPIVNVVST